MKKNLACLLLLLLPVLAFSQRPINGSNSTLSSITFPVFTLNAAPVPGGTLAVVGTPGNATWYIWGAANYQLGSVVSFLGSVTNAPNTLSSSNYISIFPNAYPAGATSVDILATQSFGAPSGTCNCAVATGLTSGGANFQSNSLSSYTVSLWSPQSYELLLRNEVVGANSSHLILRNAYTLAQIADLSAAGGGTVTGSGTLATIPVWTSGTGIGNSVLQQITLSGGAAGVELEYNQNTTAGALFNSTVTSGASSDCSNSITLPYSVNAAGWCYGFYGYQNSTGTNSSGENIGLVGVSFSTHANPIGVVGQAIGNGTGNATLIGGDFSAQPGSSGVSSAVYGVRGFSEGLGSSTIPTSAAVVAVANGAASGGTITNNYGLYAPAGANVGTITNNYSAYFSDTSSATVGGTVTNAFGIYVGSTGPSVFVGGIQQNGAPLGDYCGTTTTCGNTAAPLMRVVYGSAALTSASPSTAVITGFSPAFSSTSSYRCTVTNETTAANGLKYARTSTSSITITGPNTVTDTVSYICTGT